ncbi:ComEC/Rec2 family competence protein [Paracoccus limosus]
MTQGMGRAERLPAMGTAAGWRRPAQARSPVTVRAGLLPWVPLWMALGVGGWFALPFEPGQIAYVLAAGVVAAGLAFWFALPWLVASGRIGWAWGDQLRLLALALLLAALGFGFCGLRSWMVAAPVLDFRYYGPVEGRVVEIDRSARDRFRLTLDQVVLDDVTSDRVPQRVRISLFDDGPLPVPGQRVMLSAHLGPPNGPAEPGGFDFRRMAWFESLGAIGYARTPVLTVEPPRPGGALALHRLRMRLAQGMRDSIGGQAGAVAAALMTGDRSGIDERTNDIMRASNLYHIVSISGLHMSMLAGFVYAGLRLLGVGLQAMGVWLGGGLHKWAAAGALLAAAVYLWLSGGGVATERSFVMVAVMLLAILADRRAVSLRTVAVAAVVILARTPEGLTTPGFQMSFAATVALILSQGPWSSVAPRLPVWLRPVAMLLLSSLVASLATSPLAAAHFGRMTQYGLLANLLVVPVVGILVMPGGVIAALLAPLGLAQPALWCMGLGVKWMLLVAGWIASLGGAVTLVRLPPPAVVPLLGLGACLLLLAPALAAQGLAPRRPWRRLSGAALLLVALLLWSTNHRPLLLISAEGDAIAMMTAAGRVPSKPKGGAFAVAEWLEGDADAADQQAAAARPLWQGAAGARSAYLALPGGDLAVHHLTGKRAAALAPPLCRGGALLISDADLGAVLGRRPDCTLLDMRRLRASGAVAVRASGSGYVLITTRAQAGARAWTAPPRRKGD